MVDPQMKSFRESRWRYSQFAVLGLVVAGIVKGLSGLTWLMALLVGGAVGVAYLLFEKKRGAI